MYVIFIDIVDNFGKSFFICIQVHFYLSSLNTMYVYVFFVKFSYSVIYLFFQEEYVAVVTMVILYNVGTHASYGPHRENGWTQSKIVQKLEKPFIHLLFVFLVARLSVHKGKTYGNKNDFKVLRFTSWYCRYVSKVSFVLSFLHTKIHVTGW